MDTHHPIETAVIPVAGIGSRMTPATWSIEKCMLPVYTGGKTRLLIDWMVEECATAGLKRIIFVTTERGKKQLADYFEEIDSSLEMRYQHLGKENVIAHERARRVAYGLAFEYVVQPVDAYGTTVPPMVAKPLLQGEKRFFLMGGDDFVYHQEPGVSELALAIETWNKAGTDHVIMAKAVPPVDATHLGVLFTDEQQNLTQWVEKPPLQDMPKVPFVMANTSRYGFSDVIWEQLEQEMTEKREGEHLITYPVLNALAAGQKFRIHSVKGAYLGGGTAEELIATGHYIADHPRIK